GIAYIKLDQVDDAIEALIKAVSIDSKAFNPRLNLGIAYMRKLDFAGSETHLRAALALDSSSALAHMYLGIALEKQGRFDEAEDELLRALALNKTEVAIAHYYLGQLYVKRQRVADAIAAFEAYLKEKPDAADAPRIREQITDLRSRGRQ